MPRSNKKKRFFLSQPNVPTGQSSQISYLLQNEKNKMISRAINSGRNHGIDMVAGTSNPGLGDCAFEAIIQNNNDRSCFEEKFFLPINHYRGIWTTDMANRTVDGPWNTYSHNDCLEGWKQMQIPGTYERGIFGDLMLPGIACGVKKILLSP